MRHEIKKVASSCSHAYSKLAYQKRVEDILQERDLAHTINLYGFYAKNYKR